MNLPPIIFGDTDDRPVVIPLWCIVMLLLCVLVATMSADTASSTSKWQCNKPGGCWANYTHDDGTTEKIHFKTGSIVNRRHVNWWELGPEWVPLNVYDPATMPAVPSMVGVADGYVAQGGGGQIPVCQTCAATSGPEAEESFGLPVCIRAYASIDPTKGGKCRELHAECINYVRCNFSCHYEYAVPPGHTLSVDTFDTDMHLVIVEEWTNNGPTCMMGGGNAFEAVDCGGGGTLTVVVSDGGGSTAASASVDYDCGDPCPDSPAAVVLTQ